MSISFNASCTVTSKLQFQGQPDVKPPYFSVDDEGYLVLAPELKGIKIKGFNGIDQVTLTAEKNKGGGIKLAYPNGNQKVLIDSQGIPGEQLSPLLQLTNPSEQPMVSLFNLPNDGGIIQTHNKSGQVSSEIASVSTGGRATFFNNRDNATVRIANGEDGGVIQINRNDGPLLAEMGSYPNGGVVLALNNKANIIAQLGARLGNEAYEGIVAAFDSQGHHGAALDPNATDSRNAAGLITQTRRSS